VIVGIGVDLEARVLEERTMILPARLADPDLRSQGDTAQKICADLQAACATQCLHSHHTVFLPCRTLGAEYQRLDRTIVLGQPIDRQITARRRAVYELPLGATHALEQGNL